MSLCPFAQQRHEGSSGTKKEEGNQHLADGSLAHGVTEHELMRHQLDEGSVNENSSGDRVKDTVDDECGSAGRRVAVSNTQANSNSNRSRDSKAKAQEVGSVALRFGPGNGSQTRTKTKSFKGLVEDKHNIKGSELGTRHCKSETNEDRVEDDTELQDEDRSKLSGVVLSRLDVSFGVAVIVMLTGMTKVVLPWHVTLRLVGFVGNRVVVELGVGIAFLIVQMALAKVRETHNHQLHKKENNNGHEDDALDPTVFSNWAGQALVFKCLLGGTQQVNESSRNDHTGSEVLGDEKGPFGESTVFAKATGEDGEQSTKHGASHDHKDGGNPQAHAAVELIAGFTSILALEESGVRFHSVEVGQRNVRGNQ